MQHCLTAWCLALTNFVMLSMCLGCYNGMQRAAACGGVCRVNQLDNCACTTHARQRRIRYKTQRAACASDYLHQVQQSGAVKGLGQVLLDDIRVIRINLGEKDKCSDLCSKKPFVGASSMQGT